MTIKSIWLRKIHKWVGIVVGLQFLLWAISGTVMALLPMGEVAGGEMAEPVSAAIPHNDIAWLHIQRQLGQKPISKLTIRSLPQTAIVEVTTPQGVHLFDALDGRPIRVDALMAKLIAKAAHPASGVVASVTPLKAVTLPVREHQLPIWQVNFDDQEHSSYYVSGSTGALLERRNDSWRWWDFFWMLHNMDYAKRTSFNHPLIIMVGLAMSWLSITGFWLLFRTMWRHDFRWFTHTR